MSKKIVGFAIGAITLLVFAGLVFGLTNKGKNSSTNTMQQLDSYLAPYDNIQYALYDDSTVSGSEVMELIKNIKDDGISIVVTNGSGNTKTYTYVSVTASGSVDVKNIKDKAVTASYINPSASFESSIVRDANDTVTAIEFKQIK